MKTNLKLVTGNALRDGRVVYLAGNGGWVGDLAAAAILDAAAADDAVAQASPLEVADVYSIDAAEEAGATVPAGRTAFRETVRRRGPTVRADHRTRNEIAPRKEVNPQ